MIWAQSGVVVCLRGEEAEEEAHLGIIAAEVVTEATMTNIIVVAVNLLR